MKYTFTHINGFFKNRFFNFISFYFSVQVLQTIITFFLLPFITRFLSPDQLGIYATCLTFSYFFIIVFFLGVTEVVYFSLLNKDSSKKTIVSSVLYFEIFIILLGLLLNFFFLFLVGERTLFNIPFYPYLFFTIIFSLFYILLNNYNLILQATERLKLYTILNFSVFLFINLLSLYLLVFYEFGAMSFIYSYFITYILLGIFIVFHIFTQFGYSFDKKSLLDALKFSIPLIPHNLAHWTRSNLDKIFLTTLASPAHTGIYQIAISFGNFFNFSIEGFRLINNPRFFTLIQNQHDNEKKLVSILPLSVGFYSIMALLLSLFSYDLISWLFRGPYISSYIFIPLVMVSFLYYLIYINLVNVLFYLKKTTLVSAITGTISIFNFFICFILIKQYQIWGATISLLISNFLFGILVYLFGKKHNRLKWPIWLSNILCILPGLSLFPLLYMNFIWFKIIIFISISTIIFFLIKNHLRNVIT